MYSFFTFIIASRGISTSGPYFEQALSQRTRLVDCPRFRFYLLYQPSVLPCLDFVFGMGRPTLAALRFCAEPTRGCMGEANEWRITSSLSLRPVNVVLRGISTASSKAGHSNLIHLGYNCPLRRTNDVRGSRRGTRNMANYEHGA